MTLPIGGGIHNQIGYKRGMLVNRRLKVFYSPRRHEGHEVYVFFLRVLRVFVVIIF